MKRVASCLVPVITVDRKLPLSLQRQIYDSFRLFILDGRLRPGQRIPSTRVLAAEVGVSRVPVLNAYAQLLAEGYIESRVGAGTVVSASLPEQSLSRETAGLSRAATRSGPRRFAKRCSLLPEKEGFVWMQHFGAFRVGQVAIHQFPVHLWSRLVARQSRLATLNSFHYGALMGSSRLRRAIAHYLKVARAVRCEADQVLIVNGSQQALEIATRVLLDPEDRVWIEEPSYGLARDVFTLNGCRLVPVPVDEEGLAVSAGIKAGRDARAAFVTPSHQFPLGVTMSASRRLQLIEWAQHSGAWILEDDYDSEFRYESSPIASLQGLDPNSRVIYIGTFSKVLFPALRLGYLVVPSDLVDAFATMRRVVDLGMPTLMQEVLADFIEEGHYARHIRRMRLHYAAVRSALSKALEENLSDVLAPVGDEAGMHLTVLLRDSRRDEPITRRAHQQNLSLWPLSRSYIGKPRQGFILGFGGIAEREVTPAIRKLQVLLTAV